MRWTTPGGMAVAVNWGSQPLRNFSHRDLSSAIRNGAESSVISTPLSQDQHSFGCGSQLGLRYGRCRSAAIELPVQREGSVDQSEVREGLREVADLLTGERNFF